MGETRVVITAFGRPEMLWHCLWRIDKADKPDGFRLTFRLDHGFDREIIDVLRMYGHLPADVSIAPKHPFHSSTKQSANVLGGLFEACRLTDPDTVVHLVEDDVMVGLEHFIFSDKAHRSGEFFCVITSGNCNGGEEKEEPAIGLKISTATYRGIGTSFRAGAFLKNMLYFGGMTVLPAHVIGGIKGEEYLKKYQYDMPPGTGNYVVLPEDIKKGQSITLTRRTNYWGKDDPLSRGSNNFDKVKILIIQDENLAYEKFHAGELDFMGVGRAQWWHTKFNFDEIKKGWIQKRKVFTDDPVGFGGLAFNARKEPFNDERIREAITLLFNRKQIVEKVLYNEYLINYSYYPNSPYENPRNPHLDYNPDRACQLLDEAGYTQRNAEGIRMKNGKPFVIEFPTMQQLSHVNTPIEEDFRKAGVKLNIRYVDGVTQFKLMNDRNFDMIYTSWGGLLFPNPISSFKSDLADKPNTNNELEATFPGLGRASVVATALLGPSGRVFRLSQTLVFVGFSKSFSDPDEAALLALHEVAVLAADAPYAEAERDAIDAIGRLVQGTRFEPVLARRIGRLDLRALAPRGTVDTLERAVVEELTRAP